MYLTYLNTTQMLGTFDKVAVSGSQRWAFNYVTGSENYTNMLNMTPSVYVLEFNNKISSEITATVKNFIDGTAS